MATQALRQMIHLAVLSAATVVAGCGGTPDAAPTSNSTATPQAPFAGSAENERALEIERKEQELAAREAELALQEREAELARREKELAMRASNATPKATAPAKSPVKKEAVAAAAPEPAKPPAPVSVVVPAGTQLSLGLSSDLSTKTARVGDPVDARLASDLVVDGRRIVSAGSPVRGAVTEVVSGSNQVGGVPTLALRFDRVELDNGTTIAISGHAVQQGASETGKDAAKIVGGAAAGAVIGHQIDHDKGKIIGGLLGGAAGAVAAKKTGGDVAIPAGSVILVALDAPFEVSGG
jgi:hypothetical protein